MSRFPGLPPVPSPGAGSSRSTSRIQLPAFDEVEDGFGNFQDAIRGNQPQADAINEQRNLRTSLDSLFADFGQGQRARINQQFETVGNNAAGGLASRGFAGSSLNIPAQLGVERERQLAIGDLNDQLLGRQIQSQTGIADRISDLQFGTSQQATSLIGSLLGSARSLTDSSSIGQAPSGGGGGGSGGPSKIPIGPPAFGPPLGGVGSGGVTAGSGGAASGGAPSGGGPQIIDNPFAGDSGGGGGGSGGGGSGGGGSGGGGSGGGGSGGDGSGGGNSPEKRRQFVDSDFSGSLKEQQLQAQLANAKARKEQKDKEDERQAELDAFLASLNAAEAQ